MRRNGPGAACREIRIDGEDHALLRLGVIASVALASSGAGYYRAIYVPERDAALAQQRVEDETRAYAQVRAAQVRRASSWSNGAPRARGGEPLSDLPGASCLAKSNMPQGYCAAVYRTRDGSPDCMLPVAIAADLDGGLTIARNRCQREREAAVR